VQELVELKAVEDRWIPNGDQATGILTTPLPRSAFTNSLKFKEQQLQAQEQVRTEDISKVEQYIVIVEECLNVISEVIGRILYE
jgi:hypothetical protein